MDSITVCHGIRMPFFPQRPVTGPAIRTKKDAAKLWSEIKDPALWVPQPKLNEDRAVLAKVDGRIYIQNRYARWFAQPVTNLGKWCKNLPDGCVFDGGVYNRQFFAFEALCINGRSLLLATTMEREVLAFQFSRLCGVPWMFERPDRAWLMARTDNMPKYEGLVLKRASAPYVIAGSPDQENSNWFRRRWM